jgi:hypothetical protein
MSEERKHLIDQILTFPANTYSREYLDGPHPRTRKPYTVRELEVYLEELQQTAARPGRWTREQLVKSVVGRLPDADRANAIQWAESLSDGVLEHLRTSSTTEVNTIYQRMRAAQQDPEVLARRHEAEVATARRILDGFFLKHPEVADNVATRQALVRRASTLPDNGIITLEHLEEALQLLVVEGTVKAKKIPTAAERKAQQAQDRQTFQIAARKYGFADNEANFKFIVATLGPGFSENQIPQIQSQLAPVGPEEQQDRDEQERQEIIEEISGSRVMPMQDKAKLEGMPLDQLRVEVAKVRDERRLRQMSGTELRAYIRGQQQPSPAAPELPNYVGRDDLIAVLNCTDGSEFPDLLDRKIFANGRQAFEYLCSKWGFDVVNKRLGVHVAPSEIAGIVREVVHPFDKN